MALSFGLPPWSLHGELILLAGWAGRKGGGLLWLILEVKGEGPRWAMASFLAESSLPMPEKGFQSGPSRETPWAGAQRSADTDGEEERTVHLHPRSEEQARSSIHPDRQTGRQIAQRRKIPASCRQFRKHPQACV